MVDHGFKQYCTSQPSPGVVCFICEEEQNLRTYCHVEGLFWVKPEVVGNQPQPPLPQFVFWKVDFKVRSIWRGSSDSSGGGDKKRTREGNMQIEKKPNTR